MRTQGVSDLPTDTSGAVYIAASRCTPLDTTATAKREPGGAKTNTKSVRRTCMRGVTSGPATMTSALAGVPTTCSQERPFWYFSVAGMPGSSFCWRQ